MILLQKQEGNPDIFDVAKAAGVSISTVSRSFNHPDQVRPATRKRIARAVRRLGYIRNRAAQTMHGRRSATVGLVVPTIDNAIFAEVVQSFSDTLEAEGFSMLIASHGFDLDREYAMVRKFLEHRVDGVALVGTDRLEATQRLIERQGVPALAIWNHRAESRLSCVGADNRLAGRMAARHLLALGHRAIGLIFPRTEGNDRARDRLHGALAELERAGASPPAAWRGEASYNVAEAKQAAGPILQAAPRPTALLCANDIIAQGAVYAASRAGLAVPQALSIMGIGDFKGSADMEPALSTVRIPARRIGALAGHEMARAITGDDLNVTRQTCALRLLPRGTAGPAPRGP